MHGVLRKGRGDGTVIGLNFRVKLSIRNLRKKGLKYSECNYITKSIQILGKYMRIQLRFDL